MADSIIDRLAPRLDPVLHPDATAALNRVAQYGTDGAKATKAASFSDLDNLRKVVADAAASPKPADAALAGQIKDHIDDFVENLKPAHLDTSAQDAMRADLVSATSRKGQIAKQIKSIEQSSPGALAARGAAGADIRANYMDLHQQLQDAEAARQQALGAFKDESSLINAGPQDTIDALNSARGLWSRAKQAETIQGVIDKAGISASANYSQSGVENALRQRFKSLALNDKAMARLSPEVQTAVKQVAQGSPVGNVLRAVGKFAPHGPVATAAGMGTGYMLGGVEGGGIGALALPMLGEAARAGATRMTTKAAQRAMDIAALGRTAQPRPLSVPPLQIPSLPQGRALPYGLFGSALQQQQRVSQ